MIFFAKITQISDFLVFPNFRKVGKFVALTEALLVFGRSVEAAKCFSFKGALPRPLDPAGGSASRPPLKVFYITLAMRPCPSDISG